MIQQLLAILERNTPIHLALTATIILTLAAILTGVRFLVRRHLARTVRHTAARWDDILVDTAASTPAGTLLLLSFLLGIQTLEISSELHTFATRLLLATILFQCGLWANRLIRNAIALRVEKNSRKGPVTTNYGIIRYTLYLILWSVITLLILSNLGINVTSLIASLGIGGVAVALAVQNILGDLFASLSIMLDKPFEIGDTLTIDDLTGTVRHIGLKTTRLAAVTGEELVFANSDLLGSRIHNHRKMEERRVVQTLGIDSSTPPEYLMQVNHIVQDIFHNLPQARLERVHFCAIGAYTFDYEIVYHILDADYNLYMDIRQTLNIELVTRLGKAGIGLPDPTRTIRLQKLS
ncbi:MAG: mechanosensitive ion channel family protein [Alistipes senegalensis]|nr:mechanosensitive ion channel family protein [Oxalobacter formigenes]MCM1281836.1 mechanosensitive ion channel family protein [Alistipes senegalensis]